MNILVTGANGQLGSELQLLAKEMTQFNWLFTDVEEMDITDEKSILKNFDAFKPNVLINAAAYTAVDKAETDSELAYSINTEAVKHITNICNMKNCFFCSCFIGLCLS